MAIQMNLPLKLVINNTHPRARLTSGPDEFKSFIDGMTLSFCYEQSGANRKGTIKVTDVVVIRDPNDYYNVLFKNNFCYGQFHIKRQEGVIALL